MPSPAARPPGPPTLDVLVVGAGPTGLALAARLRSSGTRFRIVDRHPDRAHESRAVVVQPRTLEVLAPFGVSGEMLAGGNPAAGLSMHFRNRVHTAPLFDIGVSDSRYPYLLFLSQAETERILVEHLARHQVRVERQVELTDLKLTGDAGYARLRHPDGSVEEVTARYVVGCDGVHSTVRRCAGVPFVGHSYPQTFVLADLEADGISPGGVHMFMSGRGILFFFPLGTPVTWRMMSIRPPGEDDTAEVTLDRVQAIVDAYTRQTPTRVRLRDPVWMTNFRLHNRRAAHYRAGPAFLAGDAAHVHSPAGGQGMNVGIQDAVNLGWKLAMVCAGTAEAALLDSYEAEREPVGREVLRFTNRAFTIATSENPLLRMVRTRVVPRLVPFVLRQPAGRAAGFRAVSELGVAYRQSPLSVDGPGAPRRGPRAGDRLPDAEVELDGTATSLHAVLAGPGFHLLLCGRPAQWRGQWPAQWPAPAGGQPAELALPAGGQPAELALPAGGVLQVHRLDAEAAPGVLHDRAGLALARLGVAAGRPAQYLIRPDGHVAYRAGGTDLGGVRGYLDRWLPGWAPAVPA